MHQGLFQLLHGNGHWPSVLKTDVCAGKILSRDSSTESTSWQPKPQEASVEMRSQRGSLARGIYLARTTAVVLGTSSVLLSLRALVFCWCCWSLCCWRWLFRNCAGGAALLLGQARASIDAHLTSPYVSCQHLTKLLFSTGARHPDGESPDPRLPRLC